MTGRGDGPEVDPVPTHPHRAQAPAQGPHRDPVPVLMEDVPDYTGSIPDPTIPIRGAVRGVLETNANTNLRQAVQKLKTR